MSPATPIAPARPGTGVVPYTEPAPPAIGITGFVRRVTDLGLGAASLAASAAVDAIERLAPGEVVPPDEVPPPTVLRHVPGALMGAGLAAQRQLLEATAVAERGVARAVGALARAPVVGAQLRVTEEYLVAWSDRAATEQARNRALVAEFVRRVAPELASAVVAQLDIDRLVEQLPIDAIIAKVDIDALLARVDVNGIVQRVDLDAILQRVDLNAIMQEVDLGSIVRESTGSITGDVVDGGRLTVMRLDDFIGRVSDKVLLRRKGRDIGLPDSEPGASEEPSE